jgi:hypothetical protein
VKGLLLVALALGFWAPVLAGTGFRGAQKPDDESIILDSTVAILPGSDEPLLIGEAAQDLAGDLEKVLGKKPRIVHRKEDAAPVTILLGCQSRLLEGMCPADLTERESFSISVRKAEWRSQQPTEVVLLAGADMRGTIYAVYEFAEEYLGIDPLYYWTDHQPIQRAQIELPGSLKKKFPALLFKCRGFFVNDEDLLTGWAPGHKEDATGISLEVWNKVFETILRLKGNMVAPGTWVFPDEPQVELAGPRGLIVTQHHAIPLGLNVARWPEGVPYSYRDHPEILEQAWKNAAAAYLVASLGSQLPHHEVRGTWRGRRKVIIPVALRVGFCLWNLQMVVCLSRAPDLISCALLPGGAALLSKADATKNHMYPQPLEETWCGSLGSARHPSLPLASVEQPGAL